MERGSEVMGWVLFAFALGFISPAFTMAGLCRALWVAMSPRGKRTRW